LSGTKDNIKGIVLAGGTGSRLFPLTKVTNKHLLPVGNKPMIFHPLERLIEAGVHQILIVSGTEHLGDVVRLLGSGAEMNCDFTFKVQDQAGGIAEALSLAENFCAGSRSVVILGDNIFDTNIKKELDAFRNQEQGARIIIKEVPDPHRFGVPTMEGDKIVKITEKPQNPDSKYAVTGIYMYDSQVFEFIRSCSRSQRGELEITDVNNFYINKGQCTYGELSGWWSDAGTFESLKKANELA